MRYLKVVSLLVGLLVASAALSLCVPVRHADAQVGYTLTTTDGTTTNSNTRTIVTDCSQVNSSTTTTWTCAGIAPGGTAGGDLAGVFPSPTVAKGTFTGASTASGTASFDLSGGSGVFRTSTGAVTIGTGAISVTGPVTSNIGGTTSDPYTTVIPASRNGYVISSTAPASVAGSGTSAGSAITSTGAAGGATSGTTGQTAGTGMGHVFTCGPGGTAPAGSTNGTGGSILMTPGDAGGGLGTAGSKGTVTVKAPAATYGTVLKVENSANSTLRFGVADTGNVSLVTAATLVVGANTLIGAVADKLNAALLAIASQATGDILYADSSSTFARLADVGAGAYLRSGGIGAAPLYSTLILPNAATAGDTFVATSANTMGVVAACAANTVLVGQGAGVVPACGTVPNAALANSSTTVNGQTCTLGSTCTVTSDPSGQTFATDTASTTDTTQTTCLTITVTDLKTVNVLFNISAVKNDQSEGAGYTFVIAARRSGASATQIGTTSSLTTIEDDALWAATADVSGITIRGRVTGNTLDNVAWRCSAQIVTSL